MRTILLAFCLITLLFIPAVTASGPATYQAVAAWGEIGNGTGEFRGPYGIAVDHDGYIYVVDESNHRVQKFDASGAYVSGWGTEGYESGGEFNHPTGIAIAP